ncbi:N-acetyltransferase [Marmoricola endophyticus]|uniref:N-acetyltransferase n=1 Tax=Marmoricola endophyticus TaxID=2040280 RepID=A0A917BGB3_9ACTN|nr:GNAT family N-acetyltransferase [Marmoricola endophyticus]GGF39596.1 N-acetyltransferase [Marmoricola endophyticus]
MPATPPRQLTDLPGTERLTLRPWTLDDAPRVLELYSSMEVVRWLGAGPPRVLTTLDDARERIASDWDRSLVAPRGVWAVVPRATEVPVGSVLLVDLPSSGGEVEIGWHLHPDSWGHGYATEAARAVLAHGFAGGLRTIWATTHLTNERSQAVCRRLGMTDRGTTREWYDVDSRAFSLTRPG